MAVFTPYTQKISRPNNRVDEFGSVERDTAIYPFTDAGDAALAIAINQGRLRIKLTASGLYIEPWYSVSNAGSAFDDPAKTVDDSTLTDVTYYDAQ